MAFASRSDSACRRASRRRLLRGLSVALLLGVASPERSALAGDPVHSDAENVELKNQCADAYEATQRLRAEGKLLEARKNAIYCAQSACPGILRRDCAPWASELGASIPSAIFEARSQRGEPLSPVRVQVDGKVMAETLDGRARELDPGRHELLFSGPHLVSKRLEFVMLQGSQMQRVVVVLDEAQERTLDTRSTAAPRRIPTLSYVLAGVGVAGLASFAYFGSSGNAKKSDLQQCRPGCDSALRGPLQRDYILADVSLGIGLVALGLSAWTAIASQSSAPRQAVLEVRVASEGGLLAYRRSF